MIFIVHVAFGLIPVTQLYKMLLLHDIIPNQNSRKGNALIFVVIFNIKALCKDL